MRLIHVETLTIKEFYDRDVPEYAILSHTWGKGEVSLQDMEAGGEKAMMKEGYLKIELTCRQALRDNLKYVWVDTCCIDKTSSAELSEAINSMFTWYRKAEICYAFLTDVPPGVDPQDPDGKFIHSRWFTRGWTLQELLAPRQLVFFASEWSPIARRGALSAPIAAATGIDEDVLEEIDYPSTDLAQLLGSISIAERMSWAATRETTRNEDIAYCLLGIFGVNMPLLYGEGKRAFLRLQEEIIKHSDDESIFAWEPDPNLFSGDSNPAWDGTREYAIRRMVDHGANGILADSPAPFAGCGDITQCKAQDTSGAPFSITNLGVHIELPVGLHWEGEPGTPGVGSRGVYALLQCRRKHIHDSMLALPIQNLIRDDRSLPNVWHRSPEPLRLVHYSKFNRLAMRSIYVTAGSSHHKMVPSSAVRSVKFWIRSVPDGFDLQTIQTFGKWEPKTRILSSESDDQWLYGNSPDMVNIPFTLATNNESSVLGIQLQARPPWTLFLWSMPSWADARRVCKIYPDQTQDWLLSAPYQPRSKWYAALSDGNLVCPTVSKETIRGTQLFVVDIKFILRGSMSFRWRLCSNLIKQSILYAREKAECALHWLEDVQCQVNNWLLQQPPSSSSSRVLLVIFSCFLLSVLYLFAWLASKLHLFPVGNNASTSVALFHVVDLTWYLVAAGWERWDSNPGRTVRGIPIVIECAIYAALIKITFTDWSLVSYVSALSTAFTIRMTVVEWDGRFHLVQVFGVLQFIFHFTQILSG